MSKLFTHMPNGNKVSPQKGHNTGEMNDGLDRVNLKRTEWWKLFGGREW
jgi:hypothetical protein